MGGATEEAWRGEVSSGEHQWESSLHEDGRSKVSIILLTVQTDRGYTDYTVVIQTVVIQTLCVPGSNLRLFELKPVFVLEPFLLEVGGGLMEKFFLFFLSGGPALDFLRLVLSFFLSHGSTVQR